jgi:hypothetical protein
MLLAAVPMIFAGGCNKQPSPAPAAVNPNSWTGQWTGPEGTLLFLSKNDAGYNVRIQSLDGPNSYQGKVVGDHITFPRNGKTETIRATDGEHTGMKWLLDKHNCLTIREGEGFCRG